MLLFRSFKLLLLTLIIFFSNTVMAQEMNKEKAKNLVESSQFVFKVQTVQPMSGIGRQITSEYDLRLFKDSMISYLPYFGRAYSAPNPGESGGYNFTSTQFEYKIKEKKKGGWDVLIKPNDQRDVRQLLLNVSESGYASLQVISNSRQSISYYGYIAEK